MNNIDRAVARLNDQVITPDDIDWQQWLRPSDKARILPAESLAEETKRVMLLGADAEEGLLLPWDKTRDKVKIKRGKVAMWVGWSFHGKTSMMKQLMLHAIACGEKVVMASMEEAPRDLFTDMCVLFSASRDPSAKEIDEFTDFVRGKLWIYDQQGSVQAERMIAVCRYSAEELGCTHSTIDSLMCLDVNRDDYDAHRRWMGQLKSAAKDTNQTIHLVAHLRKRDGKTGDDAPGNAHDISGGHELASMADYVFNVWRDKKPFNERKGPPCILSVDKQRGRRPFNFIGRFGLEVHEQSGQFVENALSPMDFMGTAERSAGNWADEF